MLAVCHHVPPQRRPHCSAIHNSVVHFLLLCMRWNSFYEANWQKDLTYPGVISLKLVQLNKENAFSLICRHLRFLVWKLLLEKCKNKGLRFIQNSQKKKKKAERNYTYIFKGMFIILCLKNFGTYI